MKHLNTIFFVLFTHFLLAQEVSIKTLDIEKKSLSNINVQILKNNKTIDFKTTNENGVCSFSISNKGNYTLKFTSLSIKTKLVEINTLEKSDYEITLEKQITEIQEVKIKARPKIALAKQDTISYNVRAIKDGTERTVEDLVRKLPGLDIAENGKITHNGNILGQVLVDGNEFFGKNHKMATQNITAEMIDGIDLWQKYTTMSGNQSTALNLKLKEKYRGKITGNAEGNYGSKNQYLTHSNIFKFNKSGNLALITDFNSIAKDPISTMDFIEMTRQDDTDNANESRMAIPSFLNNDGKVEKKNNQFGALQYAKSNKKFSITAFSMINTIQTDKFSTLNRTAFDGQPTTYNFNENRSEANKGIFGATQIKMKKIFGDHSFLYYNFGYNPSEDQFNQNLSRISNATQTLYDTDNRIRNSSYNHFLSWTKKYTISKIIVSFAQQTNSNNTDLIIDSNKPLFLNSWSKLQQNLDTKNEKYDVNIQLKNNFDFATVNFKTGYSYKNEKAKLSELFTSEYEEKSLKTQDFTTEIFVQKAIGNFDITASANSHFLNLNAISKNYMDKKLTLQYKLRNKASMIFGLEYLNKYKTPDFLLLLNNKNYSRSFSYSQNFSLLPETLVNTDGFKLNFISYNLAQGRNIYAIVLYEKANSNFSQDITNLGLFAQSLNVLGHFNDRWFLMANETRKIGSILLLKSKVSVLHSRSNNFINHQSNESIMKNFEIDQKISSKFETFPFQFDFGYVFTKSYYDQSYFDTSSSQENLKISLGLRSQIQKEWIGNILGEYLIQKTQQHSLKNFLLGGRISYRKENTPLEYNLLWNNLLNLNSFQYISSQTNQLGTEESSLTALRGYILGGLKVYF